MKNQIISYIQEIVAEKGGIYSTLFGSEDEYNNLLKYITIDWMISTHQDLKESIEIILSNIISQVLQSYVTNYYEKNDKSIDSSKVILFNNEVTTNPFIPINFEILNPHTKFSDLENHLSDIEIIENNAFIHFKWKFPIYKCSDINTFKYVSQ